MRWMPLPKPLSVFCPPIEPVCRIQYEHEPVPVCCAVRRWSPRLGLCDVWGWLFPRLHQAARNCLLQYRNDVIPRYTQRTACSGCTNLHQLRMMMCCYSVISSIISSVILSVISSVIYFISHLFLQSFHQSFHQSTAFFKSTGQKQSFRQSFISSVISSVILSVIYFFSHFISLLHSLSLQDVNSHFVGHLSYRSFRQSFKIGRA